MSESAGYTELLRKRPFGAVWSSQLVSVSGDAIFDVALLWLVLQTTGSPFLVGITQAVVVIPQVVAGPIAGVYVDRLNRRDILIFSNVAQGAITAVLSVLYLEKVLAYPLLLFLVLLLYTGAMFFQAALGAMLPGLVERRSLGAANGLLSLTSSANQLAGYAIGGLVLVTIGATGSITYDSATFFVAAALLTLVARSYGQVRGPSGESFRKSFGEGLAYVRKSTFFLQLIVFGVLVNFFGGGLSAILAPYVKLQLHGDGLVYGLELSSIALGSIVGAGVLGKLNFRGHVGKVLVLGVAAVGGFIALAGLVTSPYPAFGIFFALGAFLGVVNIPVSVLVQTKVPNELLGRTNTVLRSSLSAAQPAGAVAFGWLAGFVSTGSILLGGGLAILSVALVLYLPFREVRQASY